MKALLPQLVEGEPRVKDIDLGKRLGFAQPRDIRPLIARHGAALSQMGALVEIDETVGKGQKARVTYLNRKQAVFVTAKSETPAATDITIEIVERFDAYERGARPTVAGSPRQIASTFGAYFEIARLIGLDTNQAALSAGRATKTAAGEDPLVALGVTHLLAPQQEAALTPTDIGVRLGGKSGVAVNSLLQERGLQVGRRDARDRPYWEPTEAGLVHAVFLDTNKRHSDGTPVRQLKWGAGVIDVLGIETVGAIA